MYSFPNFLKVKIPSYMNCTFPQKVGLGMKKSERVENVLGEMKLKLKKGEVPIRLLVLKSRTQLVVEISEE